MKREVIKNNVEVNGDFGKTGEFQVKKSAEMFRLISDSLYSRPIEAIIRELACNAYDAHKDAGTEEERFDVKIPTRLNEEFYIRDYGTGLAADEIENLYTVVFASNKTNSNDFTGCFGVGSKSPFSYTDKFIVESFIDGKHLTYAIYFNDKNIPTYTRMSPTPAPDTDEPNGLKIRFSVKKKDMYTFQEAAQKVLQYFPVEPNVIGADRYFNLNQFETKLEADDGSWRIVDRRGGGYRKAIMGNVSYDIDPSEVDLKGLENIEVFFDLGELEPAASREYLQYDDKTKAAIEKRIENIVESITTEFRKKVLKGDSYNKCCALFEQHYPTIRNLVSLPASDIKYNGKPLTSSSNVKVYQDKSWMDDKDNPPKGYYFLDSGRKKQMGPYDSIERWRTKDNWSRNPGDLENVNPYIIQADKNHGKYARTHDFVERNSINYKDVYLIQCSDTEIEKLLELLDMDKDDYAKVSEIDPIKNKNSNTRKKTGPSKKAKLDCLWLSGLTHHNLKPCWKPVDEDEVWDTKAYYVTLSRFKWTEEVGGTPDKKPQDLIRFINHLKKNGMTPFPILGVKNRSIEEAEKNDNWIPLEEHMHDFIKYLRDGFKSDIAQSAYKSYVDKNYGKYTKYTDYFTKHDSFDPKIKAFCNKLDDSMPYTEDDSNRVMDLFSRYRQCGFILKYDDPYGYHYSPEVDEDDIEEIEEFFNYFTKKYPLVQNKNLVYTGWGISQSKKEQLRNVLDYINSKFYYDKAIAKNKNATTKKKKVATAANN